jgi:hypothetical protein
MFGFDMARYMSFASSLFPPDDPSRAMFSMFDSMGFAGYALYVDERGVALRFTAERR